MFFRKKIPWKIFNCLHHAIKRLIQLWASIGINLQTYILSYLFTYTFPSKSLKKSFFYKKRYSLVILNKKPEINIKINNKNKNQKKKATPLIFKVNWPRVLTTRPLHFSSIIPIIQVSFVFMSLSQLSPNCCHLCRLHPSAHFRLWVYFCFFIEKNCLTKNI